jgi:hypothetical protein
LIDLREDGVNGGGKYQGSKHGVILPQISIDMQATAGSHAEAGNDLMR